MALTALECLRSKVFTIPSEVPITTSSFFSLNNEVTFSPRLTSKCETKKIKKNINLTLLSCPIVKNIQPPIISTCKKQS